MKLLTVVLVFAIIAAVPMSKGQEQALSEAEAIKLAAAISTAEVESIALSKHGVDLESLRDHRFLKKVQAEVQLDWSSNPNAVTAEGYDVRLTLTKDLNHYTLTLIPKSGNCLPAYTTNETGQIYKGLAVACTNTPTSQQ